MNRSKPIALLTLLTALACSRAEQPANSESAATGRADGSVRPLRTATVDSAMVVSASPYSSDAGLAVLRSGDNAVDAAVAAEPDVLIEQLKEDEAIAEADKLLLTVPNTLGVEYNAHVIESILTHVAPALGWR